MAQTNCMPINWYMSSVGCGHMFVDTCMARHSEWPQEGDSRQIVSGGGML